MTDAPRPLPWRRGLAWLAFLGPFFFLTYGLCNTHTAGRDDVGVVVFDWERQLPFVPGLMLPYMSIDAFYAASLFLFRDPAALDRHAGRLLLATLISCAGFLLFPLRFSFPIPDATGFNGLLQDLLLGFDQPYNQAPSLHISLLILLWAAYAPRLAGAARLALHVWFGLIGLSVMLVYQHHFIDVITGAVAGLVCLYALPMPPLGWRWRRPDPAMLRLAGRYALAALALAGLAAGLIAAGGPLRLAGWLLGWPVLALALVAAAYAGLEDSVFQRHQGHMRGAARWLLAPYLLGAWLAYRHYSRRLGAATPVADNVWLGHYPRDRQPWHGVLDLTNEFIAPGRVDATTRHYLPVLDLTPPAPERLAEAVTWLERQRRHGPTLVHCALGLSRSAAVVATWMVWRGLAADLESAFARLAELRPGIVWTPRHLAHGRQALARLPAPEAA